MTTLEISVIMLGWQVAKTADEAFFMAHWISAWSEMSWMQLWVNLRSVTMPPRLSDTDKTVKPLPLMIPFQVPLNLRDAVGKSMGEYKLKEAGDPQLYLGTLARESTCRQMTQLQMTRKEWTEWTILQDEPDGASVSIAELMPETP